MAAVGRSVAMLAANVAGYSSLVGADEEGTRGRLEEHRRQLLCPKIAEHHGRIVNATASSLLVEFANPTEAVQCAVELQRGMIERNIGIAPDRRITFRVGISIGEVPASGDDLVSRAVAALPVDQLAALIQPGTAIYGGGSDIAARVAALADPAGICISSAIRDAVGDQLPYRFEDIGRRNLGIHAAPSRCYALGADRLTPRPGAAVSRLMRLRSAAVAASVFATVGVWGVALWAWLGANSAIAPISAPVTLGSHTPTLSSQADNAVNERSALKSPLLSSATAGEETRTPPMLQPAIVGDTEADRSVQAQSVPHPPPASNTAADRDIKAPSTQPPLSDSGNSIVGDIQAPSALHVTPDGPIAVVRGKQRLSELQVTPDGGTAVVRGNQASTPPQNASDSGTAVVRGNQAPSTLQNARDAGSDVFRGTRTPSGLPLSAVALPFENHSSHPEQE